MLYEPVPVYVTRSISTFADVETIRNKLYLYIVTKSVRKLDVMSFEA